MSHVDFPSMAHVYKYVFILYKYFMLKLDLQQMLYNNIMPHNVAKHHTLPGGAWLSDVCTQGRCFGCMLAQV